MQDKHQCLYQYCFKEAEHAFSIPNESLQLHENLSKTKLHKKINILPISSVNDNTQKALLSYNYCYIPIVDKPM